MRQIHNLPSTLDSRNASTCGLSTRKGRRAQRFRNLPHTSVQRFRKCGVKTEIGLPDLGFALRRPAVLLAKNRLCSEVSDFPRTSEKGNNTDRPEAKAAANSAGKQPLKRKYRLSAVPADQAGRTVAKPHHSWHFKEKPDLSQSLTGNTVAN